MRKYVHVAKDMKPTLTRAAADYIAEEYTKLRSQENMQQSNIAKVGLTKIMYNSFIGLYHCSYLSMWIVCPPPSTRLTQGILVENMFVRILTQPLHFPVRIPSERFIFLPFDRMSEWQKRIAFVKSHLYGQTDVSYAMGGGGGARFNLTSALTFTIKLLFVVNIKG